MRKHSYLLTVVSAVIFGVLLMASCNTATPPEAETAATDTVIKAEGDSAKSSLKIEGLFHVLWTDATTFLKATEKVNKKMTFKYFVQDKNSLTLHGWKNDKNATSFDSDSLVLLVGRASEFEIGPGTYFSNQVLKNDVIEIIRTQIKNKEGMYVVFIPNMGNDNLIEYRITVTDRDPKAITKSDLTDKEFQALPPTNPSPPRGSN